MKKKFIHSFIIFIIFSGQVPVITQNQVEIMIYTSPDRWHNTTIPTAINELEKLALKHQFGLTWTQLASSFEDENLRKYNVIVFLHSNGEQLSREQMDSFKKFIRTGGGFVGIHAASVNASQDEWYSFKEQLTENQHILITLDESTYDPYRAFG